MELLILKGVMFDLTNKFAAKLMAFLDKSPNANISGLVCDYWDEEDSIADEEDSILRSIITELSEERDRYRDMLSVAHDKNVFLEEQARELKRKLNDRNAFIEEQKEELKNLWHQDQYAKIQDYVFLKKLRKGSHCHKSHADIIIDDHAKLFVKLQTIKNLLG